MPLFKKRILSPNTYRVGGEDVTLDSSRFRKWVTNFRRLKKDGYNLPAPFYHDEKATPVRLNANQKDVDAYNNGGFWERLWVAKKDGALWGEVNVPDPDKAKKLESGEIKEVSPAIREMFETAEGKSLKDVVTHIAMVTQPVAGSQEPFLAASHQFFARSQEVDESSGSWDFQSVEPTTTENLNASSATLDDVIQVLADMGLVLPNDTVEGNFAERVTTAALAVRGRTQMKEQKTPPHQTATYSRDSDKEPDMADEEKKVDADVAPDPEQVEMSRKYEATKKYAEQVATKSIGDRIEALKLPAEFLTKHIQPLLEKHELCFSNDGSVIPGTLDIVLDAISDMPKAPETPTNPFFMSRMVGPTGEGQLEEQEADPKSAPKTDEEVDELIGRIPAFASRMVS